MMAQRAWDTAIKEAKALDAGEPPPKPATGLRAALLSASALKPCLSGSYVVKGWIGEGALSVIFGESNVGKSFVALDLSLHVAAEADWNGNRVKGGRVVYIATEGGGGFGNRFAAWEREHPEQMGKVRENFFALTQPLDLGGSEDTAALVEAIAELDPVLVVIDTLARSMGAGDENNAADMGSLIRNVDAIRAATGAHVMLVHHSGKDTTRGARGHSSLRAAVDTEIEVTRTDDVIQATTTKQRDMITGKVFAYRLQGVLLGHDEDGDAVTSCTIEPCEPVGKRLRLTPIQRMYLEALRQFAADNGKPNPGGTGYPEPGTCRIVSHDEFVEFAKGKSSSERETDKRKAVRQAVRALVDRGEVQINEGFIWIIRRRERGSKREQTGALPPAPTGGKWEGAGAHP